MPYGLYKTGAACINVCVLKTRNILKRIVKSYKTNGGIKNNVKSMFKSIKNIFNG
ncbi:hypothetical protein ACFL4A_01660 [bacterium]